MKVEEIRTDNTETLKNALERIKELEKENAELKKNYDESLVACGVLKEKIELLSKPSLLESMQDVLITSQKEAYEKQKEQLTQAKELLKKIEKIVYNGENEIKRLSKIVDILAEAEQFLKEASE